MTDNMLAGEKPMSTGEKWRAKIRLSRWSLILWAAFATAIAIASWHLFPGAFFWVDGGLQGIGLVVAVDLVLGPALFLLVANPGKSSRERRLDAAALFTIQFLAMVWGGWQVYTQRPVAISYLPEGFAVPQVMRNFTPQKVSPEQLPASRLEEIPAFYVSLPTSPAKMAELLSGSVPIAARKELLSPLFKHENEVFEQPQRFHDYWKGEGAQNWQKWTANHGNKPSTDYRFISLIGRFGTAVLILTPDNHAAGFIRLPGPDLPNGLQKAAAKGPVAPLAPVTSARRTLQFTTFPATRVLPT